MRMRVLTTKLRVEIKNEETRVFLESLNFEIEMRVSQKSDLYSIFVFSSLTVEACLDGYYFESILKTFPGSTGVSSTSSKPHAPLTRVSQSSLNPLALKPATSTFKEIEATFILLSQEEYNEHRSEITHCR